MASPFIPDEITFQGFKVSQVSKLKHESS